MVQPEGDVWRPEMLQGSTGFAVALQVKALEAHVAFLWKSTEFA